MNPATQIAQTELIPIARAALNEAPIFLEHILSTLAASGQHLRTGNDQEGLMSFARGASDFAQFVELFDRMSVISKPTPAPNLDAFRIDLSDCVHSFDAALRNQDLVALSDEIELRLSPLFERWTSVEQELESGFTQVAP